MEVKRFLNGDKKDYNDKLYHLNIQGVLMLSLVFMTMLPALMIMMSVKQASEIIHRRLDPIMNDECNTAGKYLVGEISSHCMVEHSID